MPGNNAKGKGGVRGVWPKQTSVFLLRNLEALVRLKASRIIETGTFAYFPTFQKRFNRFLTKAWYFDHLSETVSTENSNSIRPSLMNSL